MLDCQKTGSVSSDSEPRRVECREDTNLRRRFDSTNMKNWCAKPAAPSCNFFNWSEKLGAMHRGLQIVIVLGWVAPIILRYCSRRFYDQTIIEYPGPHKPQPSIYGCWCSLQDLKLWRCEDLRRLFYNKNCVFVHGVSFLVDSDNPKATKKAEPVPKLDQSSLQGYGWRE